MFQTDSTADVATLTVRLLSAYLSNNTVASYDLAALIKSTKAALKQEAGSIAAVSQPEGFTPAVSVRKSLASPEHIISLIDGKPNTTLKRHLASRGLTADAYRGRYNLPASYPIVAPSYAAKRRDIKIGLGSRKSASEVHDNQKAPAGQDISPQEALEVTATSRPEEGETKPAFKTGKASGRKAKSKAVGDDAVAQNTPPGEPVVAPGNVPEDAAGALGDGVDKAQSKALALHGRRRTQQPSL